MDTSLYLVYMQTHQRGMRARHTPSISHQHAPLCQDTVGSGHKQQHTRINSSTVTPRALGTSLYLARMQAYQRGIHTRHTTPISHQDAPLCRDTVGSGHKQQPTRIYSSTVTPRALDTSLYLTYVQAYQRGVHTRLRPHRSPTRSTLARQ